MSQGYKALIADDEPLLRRHLAHLLGDVWPELEIVAQAADGEQAWQQVQQCQPDLVFLDIRMPALDGISLSKRFSSLDKMPLVVFTTAFEQHAVEAFENEAIDYLLKPIEDERLAVTIGRLKGRLAQARQSQEPDPRQQQLMSLLQTLLPGQAEEPQSSERLKWVRASKDGVVKMIDVDEVDYWLAEDKYTTVNTAEGNFLIKTSISQLETQLDGDQFWRIHRNCIVNVGRIHKVERDFSGHLFVYLKPGQGNRRLTVSRSYQQLFKQM
ncbi:LytTR family DNA-binding domain-containing protein [Gallaecimonas kandeliae]|uniref:LytR/AlgR family response regulator transcription factor n=1 Tax=Gallaecimonas kandeliae TaxID=3029055 RepID=UPI0026487ECD|nr:LytTR family DNA-binding domain-containing protein [Gallaecimonas kandeliae]WKE64774.1 LytTR family DNA-binding domain-containing protein [Gallaecimonas kandeliae]